MTIYLIIFLGILSQLGFNGSRVAVSYALELGANQFTIGILVALYSVFPMLLAIFVSRFVDRVGPRLPLMIGVVGMGVSLILPPLFPASLCSM
jgi:MFS family permease